MTGPTWLVGVPSAFRDSPGDRSSQRAARDQEHQYAREPQGAADASSTLTVIQSDTAENSSGGFFSGWIGQ